MPRLFGRSSFGFRFQRRLGGADRLDPLLLVGDPFGHLIAAFVAVQLVLCGVRALGRAQPTVDFGLKLGLARLHALIAYGLVLRGVRLDLGAVERHVAELHEAGLLGQLQDLHKQPGQRLQMPLAEVADGAEVRRIERRDHHEVGALGARRGNPARGVDPARIAIEQQRRHHPRIERRLAEGARVAARDLTQIQALPNQRDDETRQVVLRHEVLHARRQKLRLVDLPEAKMLAHGARQNQTRSENATTTWTGS